MKYGKANAVPHDECGASEKYEHLVSGRAQSIMIICHDSPVAVLQHPNHHQRRRANDVMGKRWPETRKPLLDHHHDTFIVSHHRNSTF